MRPGERLDQRLTTELGHPMIGDEQRDREVKAGHQQHGGAGVLSLQNLVAVILKRARDGGADVRPVLDEEYPRSSQ